ncbi:MFS transporter [Aphanothece hegewaldii CCALA 016]|uniref:MFS transporter n=1 Tax=Aphanothece hegewaldii CCALA 016 TaxID=2107694 RepID=A0A2T1M3W4_9CHRO|nr:MFS transporter [Aphanothece hegewaldii]PSF39506.1 MFS transporter [Aphanothece hegewaldii CCALA 016]
MNPPEIEGGWAITADAKLVELSNGDILTPTAKVTPEIIITPSKPKNSLSKDAIRTSLKASTLDGIFATIFSNITGGVLLSNFLLELGANATEIGMLTSIPMLVNLLQPVGAHLSELTVSRRNFNLWIYGLARILWLILLLGIGLANWHYIEKRQLITWLLGVVLMSNVFGALGSASWLSWMAFLVPSRLRGRYFGLRNSVISLTNLISVPLAGWAIATWKGGSLTGYGIVLLLGIISGLVSIGFQFFKADVNPQEQKLEFDLEVTELEKPFIPDNSILRDRKFLSFLVYFCFWMFGINLSAPFFSLYMLGSLNIDVRYVTIYSSLSAGSYLLSLMAWGRLSDRIGNRPILMILGIINALTPVLWLFMSGNQLSVWLLLPLIHLLLGGTGAGLDLCTTNLQLGVAPRSRQSQSFALVAAIGGVSGALATTAGGFLVQFTEHSGFVFLFVLSSILRFAALVPLIFVREQ